MLGIKVLYCFTGIIFFQGSHSRNHHALQIATIETKMIDVDTIKRVIHENGIEDLPIVVLGVVGIARTGKSFLISLMIEYLEHLSKSPGEVFGTSSVISGVNWTVGRKGVTKGIWLWEKPFIISRKDDAKIAVLIFDTQGICDDVDSVNEHVDNQIIYMSLSMATIYIHNVDKNWKMPEKKIYQICKNFDDLYGSGSQNERSLFNSFTVLYRNWVEDKKFGLRADIFNDEMKESERNSEASRIMKGINALFEHKTAWVLPEPSEALRSGRESISLADTGKDFSNHAVQFMNELFTPNGYYNDQMVPAFTGKTFIKMMEDLSERLKKWPEMPADDQLKALYLTKALNSALETFGQKSNLIEPTFDIDTVNDVLAMAESLALQRFKHEARNVKPSDDMYSHYSDKLLNDVKKERELYVSEAKRRIAILEAEKEIETLKTKLKDSEEGLKRVKELEDHIQNLNKEIAELRKAGRFTITFPSILNLNFGSSERRSKKSDLIGRSEL